VIEPLFTPADPALLLPALRTFARAEDLFMPGHRVLVAVSGGPDSVALLHLLGSLGPEWGLNLGVAHFDHGLRGAASREDAQFVAELARDLKLPFHAGEGDVRGLARAQKISRQMAARRLRLEFLDEVQRRHHYDRLALGHTADDQVELFFLRLLRGAGSEGLKGMWPRTPKGLVRPLLAVGKAVLLAWLHQENLRFREDSSNLSRHYLRNRVRLDLVPLLQRDYNPRLKAAIWRLMTILQEDERLLAEATDQALSSVGRWLTPQWAALAIPGLLTLSPALQTRVLRRTLGVFLSHQEMTSSQVKNLAALARGQKSGGAMLSGNCQVARAGQELHFFPPLPLPQALPATVLPGPGTVESASGWRLEARQVSKPDMDVPPASPHRVRLDYDRVSFPLSLRPLLPGDRFWPQGARGARKMQDFLVDAKIPRWLRPHLPLVVSAENIIWVPGLRLAEPVKVSPETATVLELAIAPVTAAAARVWEMLLAWRRQDKDRV
jgi:tRNA(Ile)-lysidine synthase